MCTSSREGHFLHNEYKNDENIYLPYILPYSVCAGLIFVRLMYLITLKLIESVYRICSITFCNNSPVPLKLRKEDGLAVDQQISLVIPAKVVSSQLLVPASSITISNPATSVPFPIGQAK